MKFTKEDFEVFYIPTFEGRMDALKTLVRPKLVEISQKIAPLLTEEHQLVMFPHVAAHARRTVNPPDDTWCAFAPDKRGYKKHPHFEIGICSDHVFVNLMLKIESPLRPVFGEVLKKLGATKLEEWRNKDYSVYGLQLNSHFGQKLSEVSDEKFISFCEGLQNKKSAWGAIGKEFNKEEILQMTEEEFQQQLLSAIEEFYPIYEKIK